MLTKVRLFRYPSLFPLSLLVLIGGWKVEAMSAQTSNPKNLTVTMLNLGSDKIGRSALRSSASLSQVPPSIAGNEPKNLDGVTLTAEHPYRPSISQVPELFTEINPPAKILTSQLSDIAQTPNPGRQLPNFPQPIPSPSPVPSLQLPERQQLPSQQPLEPTPPTPLPPPEQLLEPSPSSPRSPEPNSGTVPDLIRVDRFEFEGNTAISDAELRKVTEPFTGRDISFAELFQARSAVTQLYIERGYITSGALIPPQTLQGGVVKIQVVEGGLESINVSGTRRLDPGYVRSRIALATVKPLNRERLLQALQLLQLNPLIQNLSAELAAGTQAGSSVLEVRVTEAKTFNAQILLDNNRAPSVGSFNRRVQINQANLSGAGDNLSLGYSNTDGSNGLDLSYTLPINARNGTLRFSYGTTSSNVIESPFDRLDINASSRYYELSLRQPLMQTPSEEFAVGVTASRQESETSVLEIPFPLSLGADDEGRTRISALRFFQEWTKRNSREVIAARSQFSVGLNTFSSTINETPPDSRFFSWRGQAQWVRLLAPETLLLIRGDMQIADRALVPLEQIGLGGQQTIRGYRQDVLLTDNGALASAEVRVPVLRIPKWELLVQLAPFIDVGKAWNREGREDPDPSFLASVGLGLQLQISDRLTARFDYGIPLVSVSSNKRTWQENGFYFSIVATPFTF